MMDDYPIPNGNPLPSEGNTFVSTEVDLEEESRKALAAKRLTILFALLCLVLIALLVWEIVDIGSGVTAA